MEIAPVDIAPAQRKHFVYVIRECRALPQIDCFRAFKHVLLDGPRLRRCNRWMAQYKQWLAVLFVIGVLQSFAVPFLPAKLGRSLVFFGLFQLPTLVAAIISLRYDMVVLTMSTYEFWYISCLNVAFSMATIATYQDTRVLSSVSSFFSTELLILQDANFRALRFTIRMFCVIAVLHAMVILYINLHLVDQWHIAEVFRYDKHAVTADNIVSNFFAFTAIILLRNAYRKHRWVRDIKEGELTVVRCIAYRCRVRLCLQNTPQNIHTQRSTNERMAQMRLLPSNQTYSSDETILQSFICACRVRSFFATRPWKQFGLHSIGGIALILTIIALVIDTQGSSADSNVITHSVLPVSSLIASGLFCVFFLSIYQRQLFRKMVTSFDFAILWTNITIMHLCLGDAFAWTPKCFAIVSSWIWIMWVITMDALTPDMQQALGLKRWHLACVIVVFVVLWAALVIELIFLQQWNLQDRSLFHVMALGTTIHIQVFQLFFSCSVSVLPMCFRLLWRLHTAKHGELILIHGAVEYDDALLAQIRKRQLVVRTSRETERTVSTRTTSRVFSWLVRPTKIKPTGAATKSKQAFAKSVAS